SPTTEQAPLSGKHPLQIALIGWGRIATHPAWLANAHPAVGRIVVDIDPGAAQRLAGKSQPAEAATDWKSVVADSDIDTVIVATPEQAHTAPVLAALERGKPVLV